MSSLYWILHDIYDTIHNTMSKDRLTKYESEKDVKQHYTYIAIKSITLRWPKFQWGECPIKQVPLSLLCTVSSARVYSTVNNVHCRMYNIQCTAYTLFCTVCSIQETIYNVQCAVNIKHCKVYNLQNFCKSCVQS